MHSAFIWACCNNDPAIEAISSLVIPYVPPQQLPEFFWAHLEKDLELLGQDTGKGLDEIAMIMHLVLRQIVVTNPPLGIASSMFSHFVMTIMGYIRWNCANSEFT